MRIARSPLIRIGSQVVLAAAAFPGLAPAAFAQSSQNLTIAFAAVSQPTAAVPLSAGLAVAIALMLAVTAWLVLRKRTVRGSSLFGWLLAICTGAMLAVFAVERAISEAHAVLPPAAINLSVNPAMLDLTAYSSSNIDPLTVTVTNATGQSVRITSVSVDSTSLYVFSTPTTCASGVVLAPNAQCTVTLSLQS